MSAVAFPGADGPGSTGAPPPTVFQAVAFTVAGNAPPVNALPPTQPTDFDTPLVFSTANGNAITVTDPDLPPNNLLRVHLAAADGTLTLGQTTGVTLLTGDGTNDPFVTFAGTQSQINDALDGLTFTPTRDSPATPTSACSPKTWTAPTTPARSTCSSKPKTGSPEPATTTP